MRIKNLWKTSNKLSKNVIKSNLKKKSTLLDNEKYGCRYIFDSWIIGAFVSIGIIDILMHNNGFEIDLFVW